MHHNSDSEPAFVSLPQNLTELFWYTLELTHPDKRTIPTLEKFCFAGKWLFVKLSNGNGARTFLFNGEHDVYGALSPTEVERCKHYIGAPVSRIACSIHHYITPDCTDAVAAFYGSFMNALISALSARINEKSALIEAGYEMIDRKPGHRFFQPDDVVSLVGAGMLLDEAQTQPKEANVIDMRPLTALQSVYFSPTETRYGSKNLNLYGPEHTDELLARSTVICATGCTVNNNSFFSLARKAQHAREFILFGPSAQAPMEFFKAYGVTQIVTSKDIDIDLSMKQTLNSMFQPKLPENQERYLIRLNPPRL